MWYVFSLVLKAYITKHESVCLEPVEYYTLSDVSCAILHTGFFYRLIYFIYKSTVTFSIILQWTHSSIRTL